MWRKSKAQEVRLKEGEEGGGAWQAWAGQISDRQVGEAE